MSDAAPASACWYVGCEERIPMLPRYLPLAGGENYMLFWIVDQTATTTHLLTHKTTGLIPSRFRRMFL